MPGKNRIRFSLRTYMLFVAVVAILVFFLFVKEYDFPFHISTNQIVLAFENSDTAVNAESLHFSIEAAPNVTVSCEGLLAGTGLFPANQCSMLISVDGSFRQTIPKAMRADALVIPLKRAEFVAMLEREVKERLDTADCSVEILDLPLW